MRARTMVGLAAAAVLCGCENPLPQLFKPFEGDAAAQNGNRSGGTFFQDGSKDFESTAGSGDRQQRARFCDEAEQTALVQQMVTKPIIPDVGVGGIKVWSPSGGPVHADDLIGRPEDGKFCDPDGIYSDGFTWGPTQEVIVLFNPDTRLVEAVIAFQQYLGTLEATYTDTANGNAKVKLTVKLREKVRLGAQELDQYTSSADQASKPRAWLNHRNVTDMYRAIRETFFQGQPLPASYDCVAAKVCDILYTQADERNPQYTVIAFQDSGVTLAFAPDGSIYYVWIEPVRVAPFESVGSLRFVEAGTGSFKPTFSSDARPTCTFDLSGLQWNGFKQSCIEATDTRTLERAQYETHLQRDAVDVRFNGITLTFLRQIAKGEVYRDGERPSGTEKLYSFGFTRLLKAPVEEFRPSALAARYKTKLESRIRGLVGTGSSHPFASYTLTVPSSLSNEPQQIGELFFDDNGKKASWLPKVVADVHAAYYALPAAQRAQVADVLDPVFLIEPFVDAVLDAFTNGAASAPDAWKGFRTTSDKRWSIGFAHFMQNGVPHRLQVQYSLNFGAVTAVFVGRGFSQIDELLQSWNGLRTQPYPYYNIDLAKSPNNPLSLGATGIAVTGFDRQLDTVDALVKKPAGGGFTTSVALTVPGSHVDDRSGYLRQIRGERWEFVPAHEVYLYGKETLMVFYVDDADGKIGRIVQPLFKGRLELCRGLSIGFGDDVPRAIKKWVATAGPAAYTECDLVFNYSDNGNVLESVVSLSNKVSFSTVADRAVTVAIWR